jgi:ATP-dependent helicase/nuclease subunit A
MASIRNALIFARSVLFAGIPKASRTPFIKESPMFPTKANEQFTDSQKHALDCQRNLALRANAGSGKTSVLVDRMIQILKHHMRKAGDDLFHNHGITLRNIVSITFTRKAAAELKHRLRILLAEQISKARENEWEREWWNARLEELEP